MSYAMASGLILATITTLLWVGAAVVSGQPALLAVAAVSGLVFGGAQFLIWARRKH